MKSLNINFLSVERNINLKKLGTYFDKCENVFINEINWKEYLDLPKTYFQIFYSKYAIYIRYTVFDYIIKAIYSQTNSPVYKDSCVEFFIQPDGKEYFNFEFNCIGTKYGGSGFFREDNEILDKKFVEKIRTYSSLGTKPFNEIVGDKKWNLIIEIPFEIFTSKNIDQIKGSIMKGNFYKSGEDLSVVHYVSWNKIKTKIPDFHRPEFFGEIIFN